MMSVMTKDPGGASSTSVVSVVRSGIRVCAASMVTVDISASVPRSGESGASVLPLHRLVVRDHDRLPVELDVVVRVGAVRVAREVRHRVLHVPGVVTLREVVAHVAAAALLAVARGVDDDLGEVEEEPELDRLEQVGVEALAL